MALVVLAMNSQKGFSLTSCAVAQSEIPWIQFFDKFVACLVTCDQAFSFLFSKQKGRRIPCEQWFLQAGRYVRLGETTARRIRASCLQLPWVRVLGTVLVCGQANHRFRCELSCAPKLVSPVIWGRASY